MQRTVIKVLISTNGCRLKFCFLFFSYSKGSPAAAKKEQRKKEARRWDNAGTSVEGKSLDYSGANGNQENGNDEEHDLENLVRQNVFIWWFASMLQKLFACMNKLRKLTGYRAGRKKCSIQIIALYPAYMLYLCCYYVATHGWYNAR